MPGHSAKQTKLMLCRVSRKKPAENAPASHKTSEASCEVHSCLHQLSLSECELHILYDVIGRSRLPCDSAGHAMQDIESRQHAKR